MPVIMTKVNIPPTSSQASGQSIPRIHYNAQKKGPAPVSCLPRFAEERQSDSGKAPGLSWKNCNIGSTAGCTYFTVMSSYWGLPILSSFMAVSWRRP